MNTPDELLPRWRKTFQKNAPAWMLASLDNLPLFWSAGIPSAKAVRGYFQDVSEWVAAWRAWEERFQDSSLSWVEKSWRNFGTHRVPERLTCSSPEMLASWIGEREDFLRAQKRAAELITRWKSLCSVLPKYYRFLVDCDNGELERIVSTLEWFEENPKSKLYPRQLPIQGIDTKWLEAKQPLLYSWLKAIRSELSPACESTAIDFYTYAGLRNMPIMVRLRILDPKIRHFVGGLSFLTAPIEEVATLPFTVQNVLVVENIITGLALEDMADTVAFIGLGGAVGILTEIPWLSGAAIGYWGDIDTHGYAILGHFRRLFPDAESILMDMDTLKRFEIMCVHEDSPHSASIISGLFPEESAVYSYLKNHPGLRLEQERISWAYANQLLQRWLRQNRE